VRAAGLAGVPADPYRDDGGPLRLATVPAGRVVYAIGPDGIDDSGRLDCELGDKPRGDPLFALHPPRVGR
jgi:hypothetical protein